MYSIIYATWQSVYALYNYISILKQNKFQVNKKKKCLCYSRFKITFKNILCKLS